MSHFDTFPFVKDIQGCHDFVKNAIDWLLEMQQPIVRAALRNMHPIVQMWDRDATVESDEVVESRRRWSEGV